MRVTTLLALLLVLSLGRSLHLGGGQCGTQYSLCGTQYCPDCCPGLSCYQVQGHQSELHHAVIIIILFRLLDLRYTSPTSGSVLTKADLKNVFLIDLLNIFSKIII